MNPIGANTWIWVSPPTDERLAALAPRLAGWGFDVVELPIEDLGDWNPETTATLLGELGLGATTCAAMSPERDLTSSDPQVVARTQDYLRGCIDAAATVGARVLGGPMYAPVGDTPRLDADGRRNAVAAVVEGLKPVAAYAGERGVTLGVEALNRYETSLFNTVAQLLEVVDAVGSPACGIMLDTYHMNIEERGVPNAIRAAGEHVVHVQVSGNDRGTPGNGDHLDWDGIVAALRDISYDGPICIESFTSENQTIATAASIWRPLAPTQDALAVDGLAFLRGVLA